jgi:6-phosphogluconolactonase
MKLKNIFMGISLVAGISSFASFAEPGAAHSTQTGAVYTATNAPTGNEIVVFTRGADGLLTRQPNVSTGGLGTGGQLDPLGSQGSLKLTINAQWLLAVNAGSNEISVFQVKPNGLKLVQKIASAGIMPVSLAIRGNLVYVLNAGASPNIAGFQFSAQGGLIPLADSVRLFPGISAAALAQIDFDASGGSLIITDKKDNAILVYPLDYRGMAAANAVNSAADGMAPFGFVSDSQGHLLVVHAGSGTVTDYSIEQGGKVNPVSNSGSNGQVASCWIAKTNRGYVYTTNPGSSTLSAYFLDEAYSSISLLKNNVASAKTPLDLVIVQNHFLYAVDPTAGGMDAFKIESDGRLINAGVTSANLAIFAQGIAGY